MRVTRRRIYHDAVQRRDKNSNALVPILRDFFIFEPVADALGQAQGVADIVESDGMGQLTSMILSIALSQNFGISSSLSR
jgi:hypothetical protein